MLIETLRSRVLSAALFLLILTVVSCAADDAQDNDAALLAAESDGTAALTAGAAGLAITVPAAPRPVTATDERRHLLYELFFQNNGTTAVQLRRIDVSDGPHRPAVASYAGQALLAILIVPDDPTGSGTIPPGGLAAAFIDIADAPGRRLASSLTHRIVVQQAGRPPVIVTEPTVQVLADGAHRIGPPLRGGNLLDGGGCCDGDHRRALLGFESGLFVAQRFAIDFVRVDDQGTFLGDPTKNESYFLYGADVLATTGGRIVAARDGVAQNVPTEPPPPATIDSAPGNYLIEALDDGRFALYAHLQPGSLRVRPGQRVHRGQVLGLVGNSGNSTEPHLHFHIMDRPSPLEADGLPYVFDRFQLQATVDVSGSAPVIVPVPAPQQRRERLPMQLDIIAFP